MAFLEGSIWIFKLCVFLHMKACHHGTRATSVQPKLLRCTRFQLRSKTTKYCNTHSPCFMLFCCNASCQFTQLLNLHSLMFSWMLFGWLNSWTLQRQYESHSTEQNWEATHFLQSTSVTMHLPFSADHVVYCIYLTVYFFTYKRHDMQYIGTKHVAQQWTSAAKILIVRCMICE